MRTVLRSWGPGRFDASLSVDGKAFRPDGKSAAVLIPPAFGLAGVNMHTWTGWGSVSHWNAFVANLEMHGKGLHSYDPRLDDPAQVSRGSSSWIRTHQKYARPHYREAARPAFLSARDSGTSPPPDSFNEAAASRGKALFSKKRSAQLATHSSLYTEPGWNMHKPSEVCVDSFQADRARPTDAIARRP